MDRGSAAVATSSFYRTRLYDYDIPLFSSSSAAASSRAGQLAGKKRMQIHVLINFQFSLRGISSTAHRSTNKPMELLFFLPHQVCTWRLVEVRNWSHKFPSVRHTFL